MSSDLLKEAWYVLHTKSRFENVVKEGLEKKSFQAFLPKIRVRSKRRDRKLMIQVPLFPGYLFVRTDLNPPEHLEIVKTAGVVRFVGNASGPLSVYEETIESLKIMVMGGEEIITGARFKKGDKIVVVNGPFVGIIGEFVQYRGQGRVVVNIDALGQFAAVNVDEDDVELLPQILS
ncbi:MAG: transcriptional antiterminator [Desulfobacterium sp.]|nr:transcriptional antiterminator [Desulfobacterium sp.]